jgi:spore coat protein A
MTSRRNFLKATGIASATLLMPWTLNIRQAFAQSGSLDPSLLTKYIDPLPIPDVLQPQGQAEQAAFYQVAMEQFPQNLHSELPPTPVWGYAGSYPGPTIEARRNKPVVVKWINDLPTAHLLPVDTTLHGAEPGVPQVRTIVHLHGGHTQPQFDGFPDDWYASEDPKNFAVFRYKNDQEPAALWYHDHVVGNTRLNVYAGLAGFYIIRDEVEDALHLPSGPYEVPLLIQDRSFNVDGTLFYPAESPIPGAPLPSVLPRFVGDAILVNGKVWPYLEVEPRKYRFRVLNGSNSRPYRLRFTSQSSGQDIPFYQIGTDNSLLDAPVEVGIDGKPQVVLAPAERADLIVDFSMVATGDEVLLRNLSPGGFPFDPDTTGQVMLFRVSLPPAPGEGPLPMTLRPVPRLDPADAVRTRNLTLDQVPDEFGRPKFLLNNATWTDPVTEDPKLNTTEIWNLINLTPSGHPMHLHLVSFQVLWRRAFDVEHYKLTGELLFTGPEMPPSPNEDGLKDMVRVPPGQVASIIAHFDIPGQYVWHCHILEHEDHEMMRPFEVVPGNPGNGG